MEKAIVNLDNDIVKEILNTHKSGILIINKEFDIIFMNPSAETLFGKTKDEYLKKNINTLLRNFSEFRQIINKLTLNPQENKSTIEIINFEDEIILMDVEFLSGQNSIGLLFKINDEYNDTKKAINEQQEQINAIIDNTEDLILSIDKNYNIIHFNKVLDESIKQLQGKSLKKGDPLMLYVHPTKQEHLKAIYKRVLKGESILDIEVYPIPNNEKLYYESSYNPIHNKDNEVIGITIFSKNITQRIQNEKALKKSYKEKEILLAEIHHRIKNNLAIISSILQLQEINIEHIEAKRALKESIFRIKSTALIHEMLYQNDTFSNLTIKDYLIKLFKNINQSIGNKNYSMVIEGDDVQFTLENAVPTGLLFNELFTNSIKHGFNNNDSGVIEIQINNINNSTHFKITEKGSQSPKGLNLENSESTGMTIIKTFAAQMNGSITLVKNAETQYHLRLDLF